MANHERMITFLETQKQQCEVDKGRAQSSIDVKQEKIDSLVDAIEMFQECIDFIQEE